PVSWLNPPASSLLPYVRLGARTARDRYVESCRRSRMPTTLCSASRNGNDLLGKNGSGVELRTEWRERVTDRIGDRHRRRGRAPLAQPFAAERVERRRRVQMDERDVRDVARRRHQIVHQRSRQQLALAVIGETLEQAAAYALHRAAND